MTDNTNPAGGVDVAGALEALAAEPPPFLRITATYPAGDGQASAISVEMNLRDDEDLAEQEPGDGSIKSWFIDFVTCVVASMRRGADPAIVLTGPGVQEMLADRVRHAPDCDDSCAAVRAGQTGGA